jgi:hypothetical protein
MKSMTCKELGGACDKVFSAESFEEIAELSKQHGTEMYKTGDSPHLEAMGEMMKLMQNPAEMKTWFADKRAEFDAKPEL